MTKPRPDGAGVSSAPFEAARNRGIRLRIRGEFISGSDVGRLDNVTLTAVQLPAAAWLFGPALDGLFAAGAAKRRTGDKARA